MLRVFRWDADADADITNRKDREQTVFSGKIHTQTNFWLNRTVGKVKVLSSKCNDKQSRQKKWAALPLDTQSKIIR